MIKLTITFICLVTFFSLRSQVLYGVTNIGGTDDLGVLFSFDVSTGSYIKLKDFNYFDGSFPNAKLLQARDGKIYGMTEAGGLGDYGVIFTFDPISNTYKILHAFFQDVVSGGLIQAQDGTLFGLVRTNGGHGAIFSFDLTNRVYTTLKVFTYEDGAYPQGSLFQATDGNLYGMASRGGTTELGVLFSFNPVTKTYVVLNEFNGKDGAEPYGDLVQATNNKLYGMTPYGGSNGSGTLFSFDPATKTFTKLKDFAAADGIHPFGSLTLSKDGKLYGVTSGGGSFSGGVLFSFDPTTNVYEKLKEFIQFDGTAPGGKLEQGKEGKLFGMTTNGGDGHGVLFSFDPATKGYTKLKNFNPFEGVPSLYNSVIEISCTTNTYYRDIDGDGYGDLGFTKSGCSSVPPSGYVADSTDCNDTDLNINPGIAEICANGIDDNCNGLIDEGCSVIISNFTLVNASSEKDIHELIEGDVLNLTKVPRATLNIRANTRPANVGSVVFHLQGARKHKRTENGAPFALFSDNKGDYFGSPLPEGNYTLTATPYSKDNGKGTKGTPLTIHFKVVYPAAITQFTLVNAKTGESIQELKDGDEINLSKLPTQLLSVRATTSPDTVGSVVFALSGAQTHRQVESILPYSLFGDSVKTYTEWTPLSGSYTLTATPYSARKAAGTKGTAYTIHFSVAETMQNQCTTPSFAPPVTTITDIHRHAASADFNGDGKLDLVVNNFSGGALLYTGNGSGRFSEGTAIFPELNSVLDVNTGDFNGDSKADLAICHFGFTGEYVMSVLLGNGNGSFTEPVPYSSGGKNAFLSTVADFNKDGKQDLAVSNSQTRDIGILLGNGDGTFKPAVNFVTGGQNDRVVSADFNADGNPDLAATDFFTGNVAVLLGNGSGAFAPATLHSTGGSRTAGITEADFDNDGKQDLAITNFETNNMSVLLGKGDGNFAEPVLYPTGEGYPALVLTTDVNGDGKYDLVVEKWEGENIVVFMGKGDGSFDQGLAVSDTRSVRWTIVEDFNADGKPDIAYNYFYGSTAGINVLINSCGDEILTRTLNTSKPVGTKIETTKISLTASPNPFANQSTVLFSVPTTKYTTLSVYNTSGLEIAKLYQGLAEGSKDYRVIFDGSKIPSGVYLLRLSNGKETTSLKTVLIH